MLIWKFGFEIVTKPFPAHVILFWVSLVLIVLVWSFWNFTYKLPRRKRTSSGRLISETADEASKKSE